MKSKTSSVNSKILSRAPFGIVTGTLLDPSILFAANRLPMWISDVESSRFLEVNQAALQQYGYTREEFLSLTLDAILPRDASSASDAAAPGDLDQACIHITRNGTRIFVMVHGHDFLLDGRQLHYVVAEDVTARQHVQTELHRLAHHDALTGLPNRILLEQKTLNAFEAARKHGHRAAIICLDLDRFKQVNDWYGHTIGDECLKQVGTMLTRRLRGMDVVARTGGEEFSIVLAEVESVASAGIVARALLQVFAHPVEIEGQSIVLGASMGVAVYPDHGTERSDLWRRADAAMYRAKRAGGNRHILVEENLTSASSESADVELHMRQMLEIGGFRLNYQLQYTTSGEIRGMEALLRIPHPNLSYMSPDRFITIAEENGLIHPLGKWVIEQACRQLMVWNANRTPPVCIAVNVSPLQLMRPDFAAEVEQIIADSGIEPEWLEMEITERVVLNFDEIGRRMEQLAALGIRFAVDDFGTGYSSLQHLHRLPISTLKIDQSFIQQLSESSRSYPIVKAILAMGNSLQMQVIAEGVETEDQMRLLRKLHCSCVQGFLLSHPEPPEVIEALLLEHHDRSPRKPASRASRSAHTGNLSIM
jgi:diguanylate cyclase (GGDEF)-like protein/PAS domain S-box-containing protein